MDQMIPLRGDSFSEFREPKYPYSADAARAERIRSDDTLADEGEQESAFDAKKLGSFICGHKWFLIQGYFSPSAVRQSLAAIKGMLIGSCIRNVLDTKLSQNRFCEECLIFSVCVMRCTFQ